MLNIRRGTFETNSSSTHSLVVSEKGEEGYVPLAKHIKISWICTDDEYFLESLNDKLSYLISHIALKLSYNCNNYEDLLEELQENFEYRKIEEYVKKTFDKEIRFPENKNGIYDDVEYIIEINHQLLPWGSGIPAEETLDDLIQYRQNRNGERLGKEEDREMSFEEKLSIYLDNGNYIAFGRD